MLTRWLADVWPDLRQALRLLRRQPLFAVGAILVLALGAGFVTALLTFLNAELFRPWQVPDPDSLAVISAWQRGQTQDSAISIAEYRYLRDHSRTISHMAAWSSGSRRTIDDGAGHQFDVVSAFVNADYFNALGIRMAAGGVFTAQDEDYGGPTAVAIISERLWRQRFGGDPTLIGRAIVVGKETIRVVGVAAPGFSDPLEYGQFHIDLWRPLPALALPPASPPDLRQFNDPRGTVLDVLAGRLSAGATRATAAAELSVLSRQFRSEVSLPSSGIAVLETRPTNVRGGPLPGVLPVYTLLLLGAFLVLLLACANVGNLFLARATSRQREIAIRLSLGASRARIIRQLLIEGALVSLAAAVLGLGFALIAPDLLLDLGFTFSIGGIVRIAGSPDALRSAFYAPDASVFWLAAALAVLTTMLVGLIPGLRATRVAPASLSSERHGLTVAGARLRLTLLASQIALTTLLLAGAGLLTRAIGRESSLNPGFVTKELQTVSVRLQVPAGPELARWRGFFFDLREALRRTDLWPVAFSTSPPFSDVSMVMRLHRQDEDASVVHQILMRPVSANYFAVLGIPIVEGGVPANDTDPQEVVVSEAAARELWPNADPIGKGFQTALSATTFETHRVVGVAKDVPVRSMSQIEPVIYRTPFWGTVTLLLRSTSANVTEQVRAVAVGIEPKIVVTGRPYAEYVRDSLTMAVLAGRVAWAIGGLGLILATVGAFGVFAYAVEERRREIGIRMALGARAQQVVLLVFFTARFALAWGLAAGVVLTLAATPLLRHYLYGLSPFDPIAYVQVAGILAFTAGLATWIPAHRATKIDPARTLQGN